MNIKLYTMLLRPHTTNIALAGLHLTKSLCTVPSMTMPRLYGPNKSQSELTRFYKCFNNNITALNTFLFCRNMGAYSYISPRLMTATRELNNNEKRARYVGRMVSSAPATGMTKIHKQEYDDILKGVFGEVAP